MRIENGTDERRSEPPRLLDQVRNICRIKHYSIRTEKSYCKWITRFIRFQRERHGRWVHPRDLPPSEIEHFLSDLATRGNVAANTQNVAFSALLFLYKQVLRMEFPVINAVGANTSQHIPVVLSSDCCEISVAQIDVAGAR